VAFDISAAFHCPASRFEADPVFTNVATIWTGVIYVFAFKAFLRKDVLWCTMGTVSLWSNCEET